MKKQFSETIDGSIKNIIQLKTLDASLEYSQMFDALQDCPESFQSRLVGALNSLGETMGIPPTETFNKVLCKSDEGEDVKKKMYNWWRAVFEVLSSADVPKESMGEYNQKVEDLMAEILRAGSEEAPAPEPVTEDYEHASMEEETGLLDDMEFAIQYLGEIANKVQALVNFVNPWCKSEFNEGIDMGMDFQVGDVVKVVGKGLASRGWAGIVKKVNRKSKWPYIVKFHNREDGEYAPDELELVEKVNEDLTNKEVNTTMKVNEMKGGDEWVSMDDIIGMRVGESDVESHDGSEFWKDMDRIDDLEKKGYWSGKFKVGDKVCWIDPEYEEITCGWTVTSAPEPDDDGEIPEDGIYTIVSDDGSEAEVLGKELRPANMNEYEFANELEKGDDGWREIGQPVGRGQISEDGGTAMDAESFVESMIEEDPDYDAMYEVYDGGVEDENSVYLNVLAHKETVSHADVDKEFKAIAGEKGWKFDGFTYSSDMVDSIVDGENCALVVYFKKIAQPVNEATVVVDADTVWDVLELLDDDAANQNLTDLINSHVRTEEEIMDAIENILGAAGYSDGVPKSALNGIFSPDNIHELVSELGLDVDAFMDKGEIVDKNKPVTLESDGVQKFKVGDEITWRHHNGSLSNEVVRELTDGGYIVDDGFAGEKECYPGHVPEELLGKPNMEWDGKEWKQGIGMNETTEDQNPEEVKSQDKTFNQDGENKQLVAGENKKPVCEMTIEQEVDDPWKLSEMLWSQGKENLEELLRSELVGEEDIMMMLEDMGLRNLTNINDAFAFDFPSILDSLGLDAEAWSQNLEIKRKGED